MAKIILTITFILSLNLGSSAQGENLEVEGALRISNSSAVVPTPGTIQFTGTDFEGRIGTSWNSLTSGSDNRGGSMYDKEFVNLLFYNYEEIVTIFNDRLGVWSSYTLPYSLGITESVIQSSQGNFLLGNINSAMVFVYNSNLDVWSSKIFSQPIEQNNIVETFTGNFMIIDNNNYSVYLAVSDTWLPSQYIAPRTTAQAAKLKSNSEDWK